MNTAAMTPSTDERMQSVIKKHWLLFRPGTAGLLYRGMLDTIRDRRRASGDFIDQRWPAHLHIDLLPAARACEAFRMVLYTGGCITRGQGVRVA